MAETQNTIAAERDRLRAENERLKAQLAAVGAGTPGRAAEPKYTFQLSEGDRQELETRGVVNIGGRMVTKDEVVKMMARSRQKGVEIADPPDTEEVRRNVQAAQQTAERGGVRGVDYVYPSVAPGQIDPAVAGTPGINGPAADKTDGKS